ncbi:hypothetical protein SAMN06298212_11621 [Ruaniaceae bacterium KH17]|nr:hypothetical protein SAMN06298212_11621 [Ruaniaceae bacterium KH17]
MIPAPAPDSAVPYHFGAPAREGRAFEEGRALVELASEVVTVAGPDRLKWLHAITSQQFIGLAEGDSVESLIMSPHGHVEHAFGAVDDGATTWLITEPGSGAGLAEYLRSMQFASRVEVAVREGVRAVAANAAEHPLAVRAHVVWADPWPATTGTTYGPTDAEHPATGFWNVQIAVIPQESTIEGELAGMWAFEAARIAAWRPRLAHEVDERTLPHELDWLRTAVSMDKGCYRGQETVARVVNLGRPPRRIVFLHLDGLADDLPAPGAEIRVGGKPVGRLTSAERHHELGPIGLGVIKRNTKPDGAAEVQGADGPVAVALEAIVSPEGVSAATPAQRPGAELRGSSLGRRPGA